VREGVPGAEDAKGVTIMAEAKPPHPVILLVGMLAGREEWLNAAEAELVEHFGPAELTSETWPHEFTDYYAPRMGEHLLRRFIAFGRRIDPGELAAIKRAANAIEAELAAALAADVPRPVNLDPGYVAPAKLVLASCKDYSHRVYLAEGVYAELTLVFEHGAWRAMPWTYPDYRTAAYQHFFSRVRDGLRTPRGRGG